MPEFKIKTIGVIGAGTMGSGIALTALYAGFAVVLQDPFDEARQKAAAYLKKFLQKKGLDDRFSSVHLTADLNDLSVCEIVIEAALEDIDLKHQLFIEMDRVCSQDAILATNTSTLSVTKIAAKSSWPERVAGLHFFNPAPILPLVEVVRGANTAQWVMDVLIQLARDLGKTPVVAEDTPGFIVNRVARPFYGEALRLLGEGAASHADIDLALRAGAGFRMGPFELMDLIGVDINATAMLSMFEQTFGEDRYRPHPIQIRQMNSGNLGRKSGRGFYDYRGSETGMLKIAPPEGGMGGGVVLFYDGKWNLGADKLLSDHGFTPEAYPEKIEQVKAVFITQSYSPDLQYELEKLDWLLPPEVPIFIQCHDATLEEHLPPTKFNKRFIGFDAVFLQEGYIASLIACEDLTDELRHFVEELFSTLGKHPVWVSDLPGIILPRVICMLINEACFAVQEGVAEGETIDIAMQLGVNYPKGLIAWGKEMGWRRVLDILEHLGREYGEDRYRPSRLIKVWARREARQQNPMSDN